MWAIVSTDPTRDSALLRRRSLHRVPFGTRHWTRFRAPNSQKQAGDPLIHERNSARGHKTKRRVREYLISSSSLLSSFLCSLLISPLVFPNRSAPISERSVPRPCNPSPHPSACVERGEVTWKRRALCGMRDAGTNGERCASRKTSLVSRKARGIQVRYNATHGPEYFV